MKKYLILLFAILFISFASADLGTFQKDKCLNIRTILNTTQVNISSISLPNNSVIFINEPMSKNAQTFNYTYCGTDLIGDYIYDYFNTEGNVFVNTFDITHNGDSLTDAKAITYGILLTILILFWFLILFYTTKLPSKNGPDEEGMMVVSRLKYFRDFLYVLLYFISWSILYMSSNIAVAYLPFNMFGEFLFTLQHMMMLLMLPFLFLWILWIFHNLVTDNKVKKYIERGADFDKGNRL